MSEAALMLETTYKDDNGNSWDLCITYTIDPAQPSVALEEQVHVYSITRKPTTCNWESVPVHELIDIALEKIEDEKEKARN